MFSYKRNWCTNLIKAIFSDSRSCMIACMYFTGLPIWTFPTLLRIEKMANLEKSWIYSRTSFLVWLQKKVANWQLWSYGGYAVHVFWTIFQLYPNNFCWSKQVSSPEACQSFTIPIFLLIKLKLWNMLRVDSDWSQGSSHQVLSHHLWKNCWGKFFLHI